MDWLGILPKIIALMIFGPLILICGIKLSQQLSKLTDTQKSSFFLTVLEALVSGVIVIVVADTHARITVANEEFSHAIQECMHYLFIQPIMTVLLLFPFGTIGWIAATYSKDEKKKKYKIFLLVCGLLPAVYHYFSGYIGIQQSLLKHAWTAAALSNGFMPFYSLPFIGVGMIIGFLLCGVFERF